jgi:hypothetical protein
MGRGIIQLEVQLFIGDGHKMPALEIPQGVWRGLVKTAAKQRRRPETVANEALADFLQKAADEELLERSSVAARRRGARMQETEKHIRRYRRGI